MARTKNVSRTITHLLDIDGFDIVEVVEQYNSYTRQRKDLFGFADLLAVRVGAEIAAVQVCSHGELNAHYRKVVDNEEVLNKLKSFLSIPAATFYLYGWRKLKNKLKAGGYGKGYHWEAEIIEITEDDLEAY